jgi:hypothetical protein
MSKAVGIAKSFLSLTDADKSAVLNDASMKAFIRGALKVCEVAIYVSVSCLETGIELDRARSLIAITEAFAQATRSNWPNYYEEVISITPN